MPSHALSVARRLTTPAVLSATVTALLPSSATMPIMRSSAAALGAYENQAVAQRAADGGGVDNLGACGLFRRGAGERKNHVAARAAIDLGIGEVGRSDEDVDARAGARLPQGADRFERRLQRGLTVEHEVSGASSGRRQERD